MLQPGARALSMCHKSSLHKILQPTSQIYAEQGGKDLHCGSRPFSAKNLLAQPGVG